MVDIFVPILYSVILLNFLLASVIFSRGNKVSFNLIFTLINFFVAIWSLAIVGFFSNDLPIYLHWIEWTHFSALMIAVLFAFFSFFFPKRIISKNPLYGLAILLPAVIVTYFIFSSNAIIGGSFGTTYEIGSGYIAFALLVMAYFFVGYITLFTQYRRTKEKGAKKQILYVLGGALISSALAMVTDLIFPYLGIFTYTWLGPIFTLVLVFAIFVAVLRYKLFDIKAIITEIFSFILVAILIIDLIRADTQGELFIRVFILVAVVFFSYLLIKSVYREVEQRERLEKLTKDLEAANEKLKELDQLKTEFLSLASHQFRSPLTAIKGYTSLILEGSYGEITESIKEAITNIFKSASNLADVVQDFLDVSRIEQGRMTYELENVDFRDLVEDISAELKPNISGVGLSFNLDIEKGKDYTIKADASRLKQVVINLIDNAQKYTQKGSIIVSLDRVGNEIIFSVKDTGVGISKEDIPKLFGKFKRVKGANEVNVKGTGLGLYIVKKIVEDHKGSINVTSPGVGKGSTFIVKLTTTS